MNKAALLYIVMLALITVSRSYAADQMSERDRRLQRNHDAINRAIYETMLNPPEQLVMQYYEDNISYFKHAAACKIAYIAVPMGEDKEKAREMTHKFHLDATRNIKNSDLKGFMRLATQFSQDSFGQNQDSFSSEISEGSFLEKEAFETKFGKDSFATVKNIEEIGNIGPILSNEEFYFVFMKSGHRVELDESFEEARPRIVRRMRMERVSF